MAFQFDTMVRDPEGLAPDCILPAQLPRREAPSPLADLFSAILADAIQCLRHIPPCRHMPHCKGCREQAEAQAWINGASKLPYFSFADICHGLGLDPAAVRKAVLSTSRSIERARHINGPSRTKVVALRG